MLSGTHVLHTANLKENIMLEIVLPQNIKFWSLENVYSFTVFILTILFFRNLSSLSHVLHYPCTKKLRKITSILSQWPRRHWFQLLNQCSYCPKRRCIKMSEITNHSLVLWSKAAFVFLFFWGTLNVCLFVCFHYTIAFCRCLTSIFNWYVHLAFKSIWKTKSIPSTVQVVFLRVVVYFLTLLCFFFFSFELV